MEEGLFSFKNIRLNKDLMDEIWVLNPAEVDHLDGSKLSAYTICLAQYLIFYTFQRNKLRATISELNNYIDRTVTLIAASYKGEELKKLKTKAAVTDYFISINEALTEAQKNLDDLNTELMHIDGIDKGVSELIATLKRELTRRENELYHTRAEYR